MKWLSAALPFLVAPPLLILAAVWQGKETERWGELPEMKDFSGRLENLAQSAMNIGPWHGTRGAGLTESVRKAAGAEGDLHIVYKNDGSDNPALKGVEVDMFIDCGRLLDQSKHRPDRCFPAQGYKAEGEESVLQKVHTGKESTADFRTAVYAKEEQGIKTRIYWSWASDRVWKAPDGEDGLRKAFRRTKPIYKLYVSNSVGGSNDQPGTEPSIELIKVLVPAYDKVLFPEVDNATADNATADKAPADKAPADKAKPSASS